MRTVKHPILLKDPDVLQFLESSEVKIKIKILEDYEKEKTRTSLQYDFLIFPPHPKNMNVPDQVSNTLAAVNNKHVMNSQTSIFFLFPHRIDLV